MIISMPIVAVAGGAILLTGTGVGLLLWESGRKAKQTRIVTALKPYAASSNRSEQEAVRASAVSLAEPEQASNWVKGFFGVRAGQVDLYPAAWWLLLLAVAIVATIGAALVSALFGPYGWIAQPVFWVLMSRTLFSWFAARRASVLYKQMPDALAMIVRSVRTGIPVAEALRIVAKEAQQPTAPEFDRVYNQLVIGTPLTEALVTMARRTEVPEYRFFAVALALQGQTGGSLTDTLENLGDVIRKRTAMRARGYALASEARMTMMVLAALPFVAFGALLLMAPAYASQLIDTTTGRHLLGSAIISLSMGIGMMQLMIRKALS